MPSEIERAFDTIARIEDKLHKEIDDKSHDLREEIRIAENRMNERARESIQAMRVLLDSQATARESSIRDAISSMSASRVKEALACTEHKGMCASEINELKRQVQVLTAWKKNYWPKFVVYIVLVVGAISTFVFSLLQAGFNPIAQIIS